MNLVLIQNKQNLDLSELYNWSHIIEVLPGSIENEENPFGVPDLNPEFEACLEQLEKLTDFDGVVISFWLKDKPIEKGDIAKYFIEEDKRKYSALQLALFIRLSEFEYIHHSPIVILTPCPEDQIILKSPETFNILTAKLGTQLIEYHKLSWRVENIYDDFGDTIISSKTLGPSSLIEEAITKQDRTEIAGKFSEFKTRVLVQSEATDNHSIANFWGPYQLAKAKGNQIDYPRTLFFRYCLRKISNWKEEKELPISVKKLSGFEGKVLLIDDHHKKGWKEALELIFGEGNVFCSETLTDENLSQIELGDFSLIFLDYRFKENIGPKTGDGLKFLKDIKDKNPVLPVIMFTASNKAWNMDALYEAGADGYYVKEHPDTANDTAFSIKNYENFIVTIEQCIKKGNLLKPYWKALKSIELEFKKEDSLIQEKTLSDGSTSNFKGRISERITMLIGLLKKAFEQTKFDEGAFFYSDYELAFLTLWSVLNEIQEAHYEKVIGIPDPSSSAKVLTCHEDYQKTPLIRKWLLRSSGITFLEVCFKGNKILLRNNFYELEFKSDFEFKKPKFEPLNLPAERREWPTQLYIQILFIIQKGDFGSKGYNTNISADLTKKMLSLNTIRNKIYLTHGGNPNSSEFSSRYNSNRATPPDWQKRILDLFSIVYFLCTAKEWKKEM